MWTIAGWYEEARSSAAAKPEYYRRWGDHYLRCYDNWMPGVPGDEIVRRLRSWNSQRLQAMPDLAKYPELRGMRELIDAQWRGYRDGAGLRDDQWAAYCSGNSYYHRHIATQIGEGSPVRGTPESGCSCIYFPRSDRGPLLAVNLDSSPDEPFGEPEWPLANEHLIVAGVSSGIFLDEKSPEIFPAPVFGLVARYCRSTPEAVDMLARYNHFWGPGNLLVVDRSQKVAMIEKSACRYGIRHSPDGFGFVTAMTAEAPSMNAYLADRRAASLKARKLPAECADTAYWRCADNRRKLMNELLDEARRTPTVEGLRGIIQFRDAQRGLVCYNGERLTPDGPPCEFTLRTAVYLLAEGKARWWAREGGKPSFENRKPDVTFNDVWLWE